METVKDNPELLELLEDKKYGYMKDYFIINSEGLTKEFIFMESFLDLDLPKTLLSELNEEEALYSITSSIFLIRGMVNILLFKN